MLQTDQETSPTAKKTITQDERDRMLIEQMPQVKYIARRIHDRLPAHIELSDLVHAGVLGLIDAVSKFDSAKKVQFSTYAQFRVRGAIMDSLRESDWSPRSLRRKAREIEETVQRLSASLRRSATEQEVAEEMGLGLQEYQQLLGELRGLDMGSAVAEDPEDGSAVDLAEMVKAPESENPFEMYAKTEMRARLTDAIGELPERERQVLALYYHEELTMREIGEVLDVVESRVSQIHSGALARLRAKMQVN